MMPGTAVATERMEAPAAPICRSALLRCSVIASMSAPICLELEPDLSSATPADVCFFPPTASGGLQLAPIATERSRRRHLTGGIRSDHGVAVGPVALSQLRIADEGRARAERAGRCRAGACRRYLPLHG